MGDVVMAGSRAYDSAVITLAHVSVKHVPFVVCFNGRCFSFWRVWTSITACRLTRLLSSHLPFCRRWTALLSLSCVDATRCYKFHLIRAKSPERFFLVQKINNIKTRTWHLNSDMDVLSRGTGTAQSYKKLSKCDFQCCFFFQVFF